MSATPSPTPTHPPTPPREATPHDESDPYFVLEFCEAAICDAITLEDGLDAETGQRVLTMIANAKRPAAPVASPSETTLAPKTLTAEEREHLVTTLRAMADDDDKMALLERQVADRIRSPRVNPRNYKALEARADFFRAAATELATIASLESRLRDAERKAEGTALEARRLRAIEWFGCMTGDCPHKTQSECDAAILGVVRSVIAEQASDRALRASRPATERET